MLKIVFMAKETYSSTVALKYMCNKRKEIEILAAVLRDGDLELNKICKTYGIPIISEQQIWETIGGKKVDYIFSFYWKRIGKNVLAIPTKGSINFHPGPLPEARGSGYHVAILEKWGYFGVTAHYMEEEFDKGPIIECRRFKIDEHIVNKDLVKFTHEQLAILFEDIVDQILDGDILKGKEQEEGRYFSLQDLEESKMIDIEADKEDIRRKIRAFWNPPYSGAQIKIGTEKYTVISDEILEWIALKLQE